MTTIYPINPSSGGGAPPPVFNISTNGLVPAPGGGASNRVLNANGTWGVPPAPSTPATTIMLNPSVTSGTLGGVTWSTTWTDPITLSTSIPMSVARMNSNLYSNSLGSGNIDVILSSAAPSLISRNRWGTNISSITFGLYSSAWNCDFYGNIFINGFWFLVTGGAALNANNSDLLITRLNTTGV
jgi:hypothetical protein